MRCYNAHVPGHMLAKNMPQVARIAHTMLPAHDTIPTTRSRKMSSPDAVVNDGQSLVVPMSPHVMAVAKQRKECGLPSVL